MRPRWVARPLGSYVQWCVLLILFGSTVARSELLPCSGDAHPELIAQALAKIRQSIDPCRESAQIGAIFDTLARCTQASHRICTDVTASRNTFDRPIGPDEPRLLGIITWNPELRSEIEDNCDGDPGHLVRRDPTASLLHELVHAAQDCQGLNPGEHELEAVQIENIYRRAAGLCQRHGYGDDLLPAEMVRLCTAQSCPCSTPVESDQRRGATHIARPQRQLSPTASSGDAQLRDSHRTPFRR